MKRIKDNDKIIDAVEYNGKYTDASVLRGKIITVIVAAVCVAGFILVPILIL